jgi:hypothetical protein
MEDIGENRMKMVLLMIERRIPTQAIRIEIPLMPLSLPVTQERQDVARTATAATERTRQGPDTFLSSIWWYHLTTSTYQQAPSGAPVRE